MKTLQRFLRLSLAATAFLFFADSTRCFALMEIDQVTKVRAKELGFEIRANAAGPDALRVELEFKTEGVLKDFSRVDLEIRDGDKMLLSAPLQRDDSKPGRVLVGFAVDRVNLEKLTLRVVVQYSPRGMTGYDLRVKDFVVLPVAAAATEKVPASGR